MAVGEGVTEIPDSDDEPMTSSPVAVLAEVADKLRPAAREPLQESQDAVQAVASCHQAPGEHVSTVASKRIESLVGDQGNASTDVEPSHVLPTNLYSNQATDDNDNSTGLHDKAKLQQQDFLCANGWGKGEKNTEQSTPAPTKQSERSIVSEGEKSVILNPDHEKPVSRAENDNEAAQAPLAIEGLSVGKHQSRVVNTLPFQTSPVSCLKDTNDTRAAQQSLHDPCQPYNRVRTDASRIEVPSEKQPLWMGPRDIRNEIEPSSPRSDDVIQSPSAKIEHASREQVSQQTMQDVTPLSAQHGSLPSFSNRSTTLSAREASLSQQTDQISTTEMTEQTRHSLSRNIASPSNEDAVSTEQVQSQGSKPYPLHNEETLTAGFSTHDRSTHEQDITGSRRESRLSLVHSPGGESGSGSHVSATEDIQPTAYVTKEATPEPESKSASLIQASDIRRRPVRAKTAQETTLAELRAQKAAFIESLGASPNVQELIAGNRSLQTLAKDDNDEYAEIEVMDAANKIVKKHIKLLHEYNEMKDVGQGLMGLIADQRGVRIVEVQDEFGVGPKD